MWQDFGRGCGNGARAGVRQVVVDNAGVFEVGGK